MFCCLGVISVVVHVFVACVVYGVCLGVMIRLVCIGGGVCGVDMVGCCLVLCCFVDALIVLFGVDFVVVLCFWLLGVLLGGWVVDVYVWWCIGVYWMDFGVFGVLK